MEGPGKRRGLSSRKRMLAIVEALADRTADGMSNKALACGLGNTEANVCRDLKILESHGWIEKSGGKWRLSPKFGGFAGRIMKGFQSAKLRLAEEEARYASEMQ